MEMQIEMIFAKLESDDLSVLGTGLDEAKTLVDQVAQRSVSGQGSQLRLRTVSPLRTNSSRWGQQ